MHPDAPQWGSFQPVGDVRKDRDRPVTFWHYLGVVVFSGAVCAGLAYLVLLVSLRLRLFEGESLQGLSAETVIAVTGLIGAAIGVAIGLWFCLRIWRD